MNTPTGNPALGAATGSAWCRTTERFPPHGLEVEITHPQFIGTRTARINTLAPMIAWTLTDCVHPAQNAYVPIEGSGWRSMPNATGSATEAPHE